MPAADVMVPEIDRTGGSSSTGGVSLAVLSSSSLPHAARPDTSARTHNQRMFTLKLLKNLLTPRSRFYGDCQSLTTTERSDFEPAPLLIRFNGGCAGLRQCLKPAFGVGHGGRVLHNRQWIAAINGF